MRRITRPLPIRPTIPRRHIWAKEWTYSWLRAFGYTKDDAKRAAAGNMIINGTVIPKQVYGIHCTNPCDNDRVARRIRTEGHRHISLKAMESDANYRWHTNGGDLGDARFGTLLRMTRAANTDLLLVTHINYPYHVNILSHLHAKYIVFGYLDASDDIIKHMLMGYEWIEGWDQFEKFLTKISPINATET